MNDYPRTFKRNKLLKSKPKWISLKEANNLSAITKIFDKKRRYNSFGSKRIVYEVRFFKTRN